MSKEYVVGALRHIIVSIPDTLPRNHPTVEQRPSALDSMRLPALIGSGCACLLRHSMES